MVNKEEVTQATSVHTANRYGSIRSINLRGRHSSTTSAVFIAVVAPWTEICPIQET